MTITRRDVLLGATAAAALVPLAARAQTSEVVIGVIYQRVKAWDDEQERNSRV